MNLDVLDNPPAGCEAISRLASYSRIHPVHSPLDFFLDTTGISSDMFGADIYLPVKGNRMAVFGYVELEYIGEALIEYCLHGFSVEKYLKDLLLTEGNRWS